MIYHVDIVAEEDGKGYFVTVPALPGCFSQGATVEEAVNNIREAIELHIEILRENGDIEDTIKESHVIHSSVEVSV